MYQNNIPYFKVWLGLVSLLPNLKYCKHILPPSCPKFIRQMLNTSPLLSTVHVFFLESTWRWHSYPSFELSSCIGFNGIILLTSPLDSQVIDWELVIPSSSTNNVRGIHQWDFHHDFWAWLKVYFLQIQFAVPTLLPCYLPWEDYVEIMKSLILFLNNFAKCLPQLNACTNKVGPIVTSNHPNIPSSTNQSPMVINFIVIPQPAGATFSW